MSERRNPPHERIRTRQRTNVLSLGRFLISQRQRRIDLETKMAGPGLFFFFNSFIYFWLRWVFVAACRIFLVAASGVYSSLWRGRLSLRWLLLLQSTGSRHTGFHSCGSQALEHRLSSCGARA